jgi:histidyl-tRNA synthetase
MTKPKFKAVKGMEDLRKPDELHLWRTVEAKAREVFARAGFEEIRTPIVEDAGLFERSVGEATEIVEKEMYTLVDRNENRLALRPEGTASVVRAFIEHFTDHQINEGRFFYMGPMFRYERPQKGRLRQFHQIGAEIFGADHPYVDAEMIGLVDQLFHELHLNKLQLQINSLGTRECRAKYIEALRSFLEKIGDKLDDELRERVRRNPLRILDSKDEKVMALLEGAPLMVDFLSSQSRDHFEKVQEGLSQMHIPFAVNPKIVRGLDYYEKTVFEFISDDLGAQNAVAGGGRYNDLVADLGGPAVPGVGFALGVERLVSLLPQEKLAPEELPRIYCIALDEESSRELFSQLKDLREAGLMVQMDLGEGSLKSKMRRAAKWEADTVVISGEAERSKGIVILRNMKDSIQEEVPAEELFTSLLSKMDTRHFLK